MTKRKIIKIDEKKCNGCGLCIPNCPEGAIRIIDGKARLISDLFCDGLGACLGHCPEGAITIEERDAEEYNERKVMENIVKQGPNVIKAHLEHLKDHGESAYIEDAMGYLKEKGITIPDAGHEGHRHAGGGCPGSKIVDRTKKRGPTGPGSKSPRAESELRQWPVQIKLVPPTAPYLKDADILVAADCVPFAYANFHQDLLKGRILLVGCPKLDDIGLYKEKMTQMLRLNSVRSVTYAHMEVPCCFGLVTVIEEAISASGKSIPFKEVVISISGEMIR